MGELTIEADGLGKRYRVGEGIEGYDTLRDALGRAFRRPAPAGGEGRDVWVLRDVSFGVDRGEVLGVVGANGAGKTTLLKLVSRITQPTAGSVRTRGRVGSILDIGTGFHPELTGAENIRVGAAVLGMPRRRIREQFDEIVEFADVGAFLDTPLKRYSSGMRLRLAFAVAAYLDPEILAVDEVLAVGDVEFQRRCLRRMSELNDEGRTVLFVSHDHGAVARLCSRAIWLEDGRVRADGPAADVVAEYVRSAVGDGGMVALEPRTGAPAAVRQVALRDAAGAAASALRRDRELVVRLAIECSEAVPGLDPAVYVVDERGVRVIDEAWLDQPEPPVIAAGRTEIELRVPGLLAPGPYTIGIWLGAGGATFQEQNVISFEVMPAAGDRTDDRPRLIQPPVRWSAAPGGDSEG